MHLSRRAVLGLLAVSAAGCSKRVRTTETPPPSPSVPPDAEALARARSGEERLIATYDVAIAHASRHVRPHLQVERAIHATHLAALHGVAVAVGATTGHAGAHESLPQLLTRSATVLRAMAVDATAGADAALLASIAASHESSAQ